MTIVTDAGTKYPRLSICEGIKEEVSSNSINKVLLKLKSLVSVLNFSACKLGGPGYSVQVDETMMNFKCKSHRGRSSTNKTDALCMVEVDQDGHITRSFAKVIPNKRPIQ